ncbi:helix-turn-helix transcriptional regulator [Dictyobacter kobayashii]|uniref:HTH cro/C1-type domain-containing protein n=1 Tax=Dictyobacter kobayashii TaxID=2014872 RepID=A0A402ASG4_9CHLR|nr:helix-turn-helix transcriptional regulator [Dictyobacter kobayashii]GCE22058.1 hypothetical protein KDK_58580 [Dictyobacter kobayashii]
MHLSAMKHNNALRQARVRRNWRQQDLAEALGTQAQDSLLYTHV